MKAIPILLAAATCCMADPAVLHVNSLEGGKSLSFRVENKYKSAITHYEIGVEVPGTGLTCGLTADVKTPRDLAPPGTCGALDVTHGKPVKMRARLVRVDFADGEIWTMPPPAQ